MLKSFAGKIIIIQIMKKTKVEFISAELYLPPSSTSESAPGNVRWCCSLALGSLFKVASDAWSMAVSLRPG